MLFFWDPRKAAKNIKKHGVSFEMAQSVFDDPLHLSVLDRKTVEEERWVTMGRTPNSRTLVVVHTYGVTDDGDEVMRIISARRATRREVRHYEKGI